MPATNTFLLENFVYEKKLQSCVNVHEKCLNMEFYLARISYFPVFGLYTDNLLCKYSYSVEIREYTDQKNPYFDIFHAVVVFPFNLSLQKNLMLVDLSQDVFELLLQLRGTHRTLYFLKFVSPYHFDFIATAWQL